jgi:predicted house-cleaning noncanonical NTP pyrophosphatase (MazG superfamily)
MTIRITGAPRQFNQAELEQRQTGYQHAYKTTDQCCESVRDDIALGFLNKIIKLSSQGYMLSIKYPITTNPLSYHAAMIKPEHVQVQDLEIINERVKQEYIAELQAEHAQYKELLKRQLLEKAEKAEQKKEADKRAKLIESIQKEANEAYGEELIIP